MQFQQNKLTRSTQLSLREHGLHVCQRSIRGQVELEVEMPYEEILPVRLERRSAVPQPELRVMLFILFWAVTHFARPTTGAASPDTQYWLWTCGIGIALAGIVFYAHRNWWHQLIVHTARTHLVLADRPTDRRALQAFTTALEVRTKAYLRQEYGTINPLGIIEPQLRRLAWLRELDVLTPAEARALTTRLTGQVPAATLRSMGQELEGLFVN